MPSYDFAINSATGLHVVASTELACLCRGTKILTPNGQVNIENLKEGDYILTHDNREIKVIKQTVFVFPPFEPAMPVVIKKGYYGATEDLVLSKEHCLLIGDKFIAPRQLNHEKLNKKLPYIEYFCTELENYFTDTLVANGVVVEAWGGWNPTTGKNESELFHKEKHNYYVQDEIYGETRIYYKK